MQVVKDEIHEEYDYCLYVKKSRADFIEEQLDEAGIDRKRFPAIDPKREIFALNFTQQILDPIAEDLGMRIRLLEYNDTVEFKELASDMYEGFNARQKHALYEKHFAEEMDLRYY